MPKKDLPENIKVKIEERIKGAQLSKELKDTTVVEYTRKYKAAYDIITSSDLDDIEKDAITAYKLIEKNKIWPKYNIEQQKEMGYSSGIVYFKIKLRETLGNKPIDNKVARKIYVDAIEELKYEIDNIRDLSNFDDYLYKFYKKYGRIATQELYLPENRSRYSYLSEDYIHSKTFKDIFGSKFENFLQLRSDSAKKIFVESNLYNAFTQQQRNKIEAIEKEKYKNQIDNYNSLLETVKSANDNETLERIERQEFLGLKISHTIEEKKQDIISTIEKRLINYQKRIDNPKLSKIYTIREEDWSWAETGKKAKLIGQKEQSATQTILEKYGIDIKKNSPTPLEYIKRTKGLPIPEISVQNIQKYFGYKDVIFGNYVSNKEGKEHVRHFLGAMLDLAELLDVDIKQINDLGGLSIAIGAIGCGAFSKALTCYYPDRKVINVTKKRGDGTLAHEWSHYLDNVLADGDQKTNNPKHATQLDIIYKNSPLIRQKLQNIINYFMLGKKKIVIMKFNRFIGKKYPKYYVYGNTIQESIEKIQNKYPAYKDYFKARNTKDIYNYYRYIATKFNVDNIEISLEINTSAYYYISTLYDEAGKTYFSKKEEMFARAFESYIEHKLEKSDRHSNYLVSIANNLGLIALLISQNQWPYPFGKEKEDLVKLYDDLILAIKSEYNINDFTWYLSDRQDEYIDFKEESKTDKVDSGIIVKEEIIIPPHVENEKFTLLGNTFNVFGIYQGIKNGSVPYKIEEIETFNPKTYGISIYDEIIEKYKDQKIDTDNPIGLAVAFNYKGDNDYWLIDGNHRMYSLFKKGIKKAKIIEIKDIASIKKYLIDSLMDKNYILEYKENIMKPQKKEFWQLTQEEFINESPNELTITTTEYRGEKSTLKYKKDENGNYVSDYAGYHFLTKEEAHKNIVKNALEEKKSVPENVLDDYVDLKEKYSKSENKSKEIINLKIKEAEKLFGQDIDRAKKEGKSTYYHRQALLKLYDILAYINDEPEKVLELYFKLNPQLLKKYRIKLFDNDYVPEFKTDKNIFEYLPEIKKPKKINKIDYIPSPDDPNLFKILKPFAADDVLRPIMGAAHFDENGIIASDAYKLIFINNKPKEKGDFCVTTECFKNEKQLPNLKYPRYDMIIPYNKKIIPINIYSLRLFLINILEYYLYANTNGRITLKIEKDNYIGFNSEWLLLCIETMLKLGHNSLEISYSTPNKAAIITPTEKTEDAPKLKTDFILIMPVELMGIPDKIYYNTEDKKIYIDWIKEGYNVQDIEEKPEKEQSKQPEKKDTKEKPLKESLVERMELLIEMIKSSKGEKKVELKDRYELLKEMLTSLK